MYCQMLLVLNYVSLYTYILKPEKYLFGRHSKHSYHPSKVLNVQFYLCYKLWLQHTSCASPCYIAIVYKDINKVEIYVI